MRPTDREFIRSGWSTSYRDSYDLPMVPMDGYSDHMHPMVDWYLDHPKVRTLVSEGDGVLHGFVSASAEPYTAKLRGRRLRMTGHVFYLYVAGTFRRHGIARELLAAAGIDPTTRFGYAASTRWSRKLRPKIPLAEYDTLHARFLFMEPS